MALRLGQGRSIPFPTATYKVKKLLGYGSFGLVTECQKVKTDETVALKIIKSKETIEQALMEVANLRMLSRLNAESFNIVRMNNAFSYQGHFFLEFEKLDVDLHKFMAMHSTGSLGLKTIRPILQQVATALNFLKGAGVTHTDLTPGNIMLVDRVREPLRVKVIDFGLSLTNPKEWTGATIQSMRYRSPEVLLGAPFSDAVDVWSLGCIATQMLTGKPLFRASSEFDVMKHIVCTVGKPPEELLDAGLFTDNFFWPKHKTGSNTRKFKSMSADGGIGTLPHRSPNLHEIIVRHHQSLRLYSDVVEKDLADFIGLAMEMLRVDPSERIDPRQILEHPFITLSHLLETFHDPYAKSSYKAMKVCRVQREARAADGVHKSKRAPADRELSARAAGQAAEGRRVLQSSTAANRKRKEHDDRWDAPRAKVRRREADPPNQSQPVLEDHGSKRTSSHVSQRKRKNPEPESDNHSSKRTRCSPPLVKMMFELSLTHSSKTTISHMTQRKKAESSRCQTTTPRQREQRKY